MTTATATDITMGHIASEVHGTGAGTMTLGIGTHGGGTPGLILLGDTTDGTTRSTAEAGITHGTTAAIGDTTIHGTTEDGVTGTADGILIITDISMARDTFIIIQSNRTTTTSRSEDRDTRQDPTEYLPEALP